jgi:hypothetical protein
MQSALDASFNLALGIFEPGDFENELADRKSLRRKVLQQMWLENQTYTGKINAEASRYKQLETVFWRKKRTSYSIPSALLDEMSEVFKIDPDTMVEGS